MRHAVHQGAVALSALRLGHGQRVDVEAGAHDAVVGAVGVQQADHPGADEAAVRDVQTVQLPLHVPGGALLGEGQLGLAVHRPAVP